MYLDRLGKYNENWKLKKREGILIVVSGPSGVGKGTIVSELIKMAPELLVKSVSVTTRKPRSIESEGNDYFFKSIEDFSELIEKDMLLEYACIFDGKLYGTPRKYVAEQVANGKDVILEIDVQGALQVKRKWKNGIYIFILPPTFQELERRLRDRKTEDEEAIHNRLAVANRELENISEYDYVIVNDQISDSVEYIKSIIIAEHCSIKRSFKEG
ncbi:MAG: guanylate kinase [Candidatus Sericytochromatia bacterium]|nr:guanylate kinase [Candidatus Sericytochromatia bacterium]